MSQLMVGASAGLDEVDEAEPAMVHVPVLFQEVLNSLQVVAGGRYIDATVGGGGILQGYWRHHLPMAVCWGWIEILLQFSVLETV